MRFRDSLGGTAALLRKEIVRVVQIPVQTIIGPSVTVVLYLVIFGVALGRDLRPVRELSYVEFMTPGLVVMALVQSSFNNSAISMLGSKLTGVVLDLLVAPIPHLGVVLAYVGAALVRAALIAIVVLIAAFAIHGDVFAAHLPYACACGVLTATLFASMGLVAGIWAPKYEYLNTIPAFVITPLTLLGGAFYDLAQLPRALELATRANPIAYLVDGMRYGLLGRSHFDPAIILAALLGFAALAVTIAWLVVRSGWRLRA